MEISESVPGPAGLPTQPLPASVLVVDDHPGLRIGLTLLINTEQPRLRSVGTAANGMQALALAQQLQPDVVVLDVDLDGEDGLALIPLLHRAAPCSVLVLSSMDDADVVQRARRLGACGFVHKSTPAATLLEQLHDAAAQAGALRA